MPVQQIPLSGNQEKFAIALKGVTYTLRIHYNDAVEGGWLIDFADRNENRILSGLPLLPSQDILAQYEYLGIGGRLVLDSMGSLEPPTFDNLASSYKLLFIYGE